MALYAIVWAAGKQRCVAEGQRLTLDRQAGEVGSELQFDVLALSDGAGAVTLGRPWVSGAHVKAKIVAHHRDRKVRVFKRRKRKGFHKMIGHRQEITELEITAVQE